MGTKHGNPMRGLDAAGTANKSFAFDGVFGARFGRLFAKSGDGQFGEKSLEKLAAKMVSKVDVPKDSPDDEESGIPALYTYFGQFVDHDITFDPTASFQKQKDKKATEDFRTPAFDLDNVYGRGPGDQPYLYQADGISFQLGDPITKGTNEGARDLQRNALGRALIGDPRNDENSIVSQLQGLFLRFHNKLIAETKSPDFETIQAEVRRTYQFLVINDLLPRIISQKVLDRYKTDGRYDAGKIRFFKDFKIPFMPVEFSVAAYRLGHSMIRPGYRLNDTVLVPIFPIKANVRPGFSEGLTGFRRLISDWGIDWARFIDIETREYGSAEDFAKAPKQPTLQNFQRLQFAYRIDTALVEPLLSLPPTVVSNEPHSLALRNLRRGMDFFLPSGQQVASEHLKFPALPDDKILIGQALDKPDGLVSIDKIDPEFKSRCPLWTYILAEAIQNKAQLVPPVKNGPPTISTPQLGDVGGTLVAEVFLGLMFADPHSYLSHLKREPNWAPDNNPDYKLKDFVKSALSFLPPK